MGLIETTRGLLPGAGKITEFVYSDDRKANHEIPTVYQPVILCVHSPHCALGGSQRLPRAVGFAVAKELIFTGRRVGGEQALHLGLVNRAVPQNESRDAAHREALNLAQEILPQVGQIDTASLTVIRQRDLIRFYGQSDILLQQTHSVFLCPSLSSCTFCTIIFLQCVIFQHDYLLYFVQETGIDNNREVLTFFHHVLSDSQCKL